MAVTHVARDPFARGCYHRETVDYESCAWCGQRASPGRPLYRYTWEPDDKPCMGASMGVRFFCNLACFRAYYNLKE